MAHDFVNTPARYVAIVADRFPTETPAQIAIRIAHDLLVARECEREYLRECFDIATAIAWGINE